MAEDILRNIENLTGGSGADSLTGDALANRLTGGAGNDVLRGGLGIDTLDGGAGVDTADHGDQTATVRVTLRGALAATVFLAGVADDSVIGIERVIGGSGNDSLTGDGLANVLIGGAGVDALAGAGGNDVLRGGLGADVLDGGANSDTADYSDHTASVAVTLNGAVSVVQTSDGVAEDSLRNIETVIGGAGADSLTGDALANLLRGGFGADVLDGGTGDDSLMGEGDNDRLHGGAGNDVMDGGTGFDLADYADRTDAVSVKLTAGLAAAVALGGVAEDTVANIEGVLGGLGSDTLVGDVLANLLVGNAGGDKLSGADGNDTIRGGDGADTLSGGAGIDLLDASDKVVAVVVALNGATQVSVLVGGLAEDLVAEFENVAGGSGDDRLTGDGLANLLIGNAGADSLGGGAGNDTLQGGAGGDTLDGGANADTVDFSDKVAAVALTLAGATLTVATIGGLAEDKLRNIENITGGAGNDTLTGDTLANALNGGAGNDVLTGGAGIDTLDGGLGADTASYTDKAAALSIVLAGATATTMTVGGLAEDLLRNIENVTGGSGNDTIFGGAAANLLLGMNGDDFLRGGAGNDTLDGGNFTDTADYGDKTLAVAVTLNGAVHATVTVGGLAEDLIRNIENLNGGAGNDSLTGDAGANRLTGVGGDDLLRGGVGLDTLDGGAGSDMADYAEKTSALTVTLNGAVQVAVTMGGGVEDQILNIENLRGGSGADSLTGDLLANRLIGGAGNDSLLGQAGNDRIQGGDGADTLDGGADADTLDYSDKTADVAVFLTGATVFNVLVGGVIEDAIRNFEHVVGGSGNDSIAGDAGANLLEGGAGNDRMQGLGGLDTLDGGTGHDRVEYTDKTLAVSVTLNGAATVQVLVGGLAEDSLRNIEDLVGGSGNDSLTGDALANALTGGAGNDVLTGGIGADTLDGGTGSDTAVYTEKTGGIFVILNGATVATVTVDGVAEDSISNIENLGTGSGNDSIAGDGLANLLAGGAGDDSIAGAGGNDTLRGGAGRDTLDGGGNADTADFGDMSASVAVTLTGAISATAKIGGIDADSLRNIENLIGGLGNDSLTGDGLANALTGGAGNDVLAGKAGIDALRGGTGADRFVFDTKPNDLTNFDTVLDFLAAEDMLVLARSSFAGLTGSTLDPARFVLGTAANLAAAQVIYDSATGKLFFDADGTGGTAKALVAIFAGAVVLGADDFVLI